MVDKKDNPSNAELLKIATDIVMSEYVTKKNDVHEKWIVESLYLWQSQGVRMAYPQLPPYPSSKDIVERAKALREPVQTNFVKVAKGKTKRACSPATPLSIK